MRKLLIDCARGFAAVVDMSLEEEEQRTRDLAAVAVNDDAGKALATRRSADLAAIRNGPPDPEYQAAVARLLGAST